MCYVPIPNDVLGENCITQVNKPSCNDTIKLCFAPLQFKRESY